MDQPVTQQMSALMKTVSKHLQFISGNQLQDQNQMQNVVMVTTFSQTSLTLYSQACQTAAT